VHSYELRKVLLLLCVFFFSVSHSCEVKYCNFFGVCCNEIPFSEIVMPFWTKEGEGDLIRICSVAVLSGSSV